MPVAAVLVHVLAGMIVDVAAVTTVAPCMSIRCQYVIILTSTSLIFFLLLVLVRALLFITIRAFSPLIHHFFSQT